MTHSVKCEKQYYQLAVDGIKTFEVRLYDRKYDVGDLLVLREINELGRFTGRSHLFKIVYILNDCRFVKDGYIILGICNY